MPHVTRPGFAIYYELGGHGRGARRPLFLLRGLSRSLRSWGRAVDLLAHRRPVILMDNRGVGRSSTDGRWFTTRDLAADAVAVLDHAGLDVVHVFGLSLGGMVAQQLALHWSHRVDRLVLGATTGGLRRGSRPSPAVVGTLLVASALPPTPANRVAARLVLSPGFLRAHPEVVAQWARLARLEPLSRKVFLQQLAAALRHDTWGQLGRISAETLCLTGSRDRMVPPDNAHLLARVIPKARVALWDGGGHDFPAEAAAWTAETIEAFLEDRAGHGCDAV